MKPILNLIDETEIHTEDIKNVNCSPTLPMILQPTSFDTIHLKSMALSIVKSNAGISPRILLVANAVSEKDNGLVAGNLAVSIAENTDKHVFLIDCDTNSPSVHSFFNIENNVGLVEYLSLDMPLSTLLAKTEINKLRLLTCGNVQNGSHNQITSEKMLRFINGIKEKCSEFIIVLNFNSDQLSGESCSFQEIADGIILSVDENVIGAETTKCALRKIGKKKLLGVIKKRVITTEPINNQSKKNRLFEKPLRLVETPVPQDSDVLNNNEVSDSKQLPDEQKKPDPVIKEKIKPNKIRKQKKKTSIQYQKDLVTKLQPESFESEQFKMLTAQLMMFTKNTSSRVYMVTSAAPGEGKSFVASNIAISFAKNSEKKVLLIDCNLRSPSIHTNFGLETVPGLYDYLTLNKSLDSYCITSGIDNLTLLPAGNCKNNSFRLLSSDKMEKLINGLKKKFKDLIIILDSASPTLVAESVVLEKIVDGIILVASQNQIKRTEIKKFVDHFDKEKIVGMVYNKFETPKLFS